MKTSTKVILLCFALALAIIKVIDSMVHAADHQTSRLDTVGVPLPEFGKPNALLATFDSVRNRVYSKDSLKFGEDYDVRVAQITDSTYYVNNYFDYTNVFSVKIHAYYSCYVTEHKNKSVSLDSLEIKE